MATVCGIHLDQRRYHVVAIEGSAKKHRVLARASGDVPPGEEGPAHVAAALASFAAEHKLKPDGVGLAIDAGQASFRTLTLPFDDRAKIEEVIKYEVESDLPHYEIDQVVVDFMVLSSKPGVQSDLLVTAVPKARLAPALQICERSGLEANDAEIAGTALFDAAGAAGLLDEAAAQILVHVGDAATTVVVVDGGRLASLRAIRVGALPPIAARSASEEEEAVDAPAAEGSGPADAQRLERIAQRVRREVARVLTSVTTQQPLAVIYVCGHALAGLSEAGAFEVPVRELAALPANGDGEAQREFVIAYGAALHQLDGGKLAPHLRREEMRFSGKFERLELPLAVVCLLVFTLLAVKFMTLQKQIQWKEVDLQNWIAASNNYMLPDPEQAYGGRLKIPVDPPNKIRDYAELIEGGGDQSLTKFEQIEKLRKLLDEEILRLKKDLGHVSDVQQPHSALEASSLVLGLIDDMGERVGRNAIRTLQADYLSGKGGKADYVQVKLDMDFFGADDVEATEHYNAFESELKAQPWCLEQEPRASKNFEDGKGIIVDGISIKVDATRAPRRDS